MSKAAILLVEDDDRLAGLIKKGLEEKGYAVTQSFDGKMGLRIFEGGGFDLVITDLILPKINGLDLCKTIREKDKHIPIIMLTALGTTDDKVEGFDAGADDYLVKPFDFRELLVRIKTLLKRAGLQRIEQEDPILHYADLEINKDQKKVFRSGVEISLTPKEYSLLEYMVRNPEKVLSREEISRDVWGVNFDTGTNFIDVYINYLRKKVDKPFNSKLIHTRSGMGFILQQQ
ncbi:Two-component system response regulator [Indibacter alkaliphilus LW1]|jgi:two-component system copper resistance phosphate regulon response regulator CusR|uniref:Two-component system response regulator n=1 Tax=Indibacter alkaliphilus (strain CCUG 57479 / KCTC 22604 / LW1) TaxID=1189612 RepID=S2DAW0_INDAL|nr:response regulator transcription factor [Indibacter alkaliphilus]EOZ96044.1 Two-component system response regulator [Indibacter alkaliphilus LW1]